MTKEVRRNFVTWNKFWGVELLCDDFNCLKMEMRGGWGRGVIGEGPLVVDELRLVK